MTTITQLVKNDRLKVDLNLHILNDNVMVNVEKKIVQGQVQSFKSDKIVDSVSEQGSVQPALVSNFVIENANLLDLKKTIVDYVTENISTIASK